jgi:HlyD family secretion protein
MTTMAANGPKSRRLMLVSLGVALVAMLGWQGSRVVAQRGRTTTAAESLRTAASLAGPRPAAARIRAEGRLVAYPGAEVTVGSEVGGRIVRFTVREKDEVLRGTVIAELNDSELRASQAESRARMREVDADIRHIDAELARLRPLESTAVVSRQSLDRLRHDRESALARRELAAATIRRLDAALAKTRVVAPISGVVTVRHVNEGETVSAGAPIVTVADLSRVRIAAEVDEYDVQRLALGDPATITAEGYDRSWRGRIEEIPDAVVTRKVNPRDPSRPTDVRVLVAKVRLDAPTTLKLGQRVEVEIEPRGSRAARDTSAPRAAP